MLIDKLKEEIHKYSEVVKRENRKVHDAKSYTKQAKLKVDAIQLTSIAEMKFKNKVISNAREEAQKYKDDITTINMKVKKDKDISRMLVEKIKKSLYSQSKRLNTILPL